MVFRGASFAFLGLFGFLAFLGLLGILCLCLLYRFGRLYCAILAESVKTKLMAVVVEETGGVDALTVDACLEMQVLSSGTACATCQCNDVTSLDAVADLDKILGVVAIIRLEAVGMLDAYQIAITRVGSREHHLAIEGSKDVVVGLGFDVGTRMATTATRAIGTDDLGTRQGIAPVTAIRRVDCVLGLGTTGERQKPKANS